MPLGGSGEQGLQWRRLAVAVLKSAIQNKRKEDRRRWHICTLIKSRKQDGVICVYLINVEFRCVALEQRK